MESNYLFWSGKFNYTLCSDFILTMEYFIVAIKVIKYGIKLVQDISKIKKPTWPIIIRITIILLLFIAAVPITFGLSYMTIMLIYVEQVNNHNIDLYDYLYYAFSISYSLPENTVQILVNKNEWIRLLLVIQIILTRFVELILLAGVASIITKWLFQTANWKGLDHNQL